VESSPGQGTTFRVYLPATSAQPTQEQESPASTEMSRGKGERILLVEDEESIRDFATRGLSQHGYVVYPAASAQEALEVFRQEEGKFDLIFCDLVLTDESGLRLAQPAASAQEALEVFRQEEGKFDLIFCDLVLTDESGLRLAQRLLDLRPDTKVAFASGYSADKEDWHVIHEEGHPFLQKPYSLSDLLKVVREVLG